MIRKIFQSIVLCFLVSIVLFSCAPKKKVVTAPTVQAPIIQAPKVEADLGNLVPFTRDLFFKIKENGLDIRKLKFYVDQPITLTKTGAAGSFKITDGILVKDNGITDNIIKIIPTVAGVVESVEADGLRLNFGRPNSTLKFINNVASPKNFSFSGDKFDKGNGTVEVPYNNATYLAKCGNCGNVTEVKLLIKQLDIESGMKDGTVEPGGVKMGTLGYK